MDRSEDASGALEIRTLLSPRALFVSPSIPADVLQLDSPHGAPDESPCKRSAQNPNHKSAAQTPSTSDQVMGGNHESIHGTDATTRAGEASSQAVVISAQERARIDMLDREVFQLNGQIRALQNPGMLSRGKKILTAAQRARITTLKTERETLLLERNKIPLRVLKTRFKQCLADFRDGVWFSLNTFQGFDDIQQKLHSRDDFQAIWRDLFALRSHDVQRLREEIDETAKSFRDLQANQLRGLETQRKFAVKKHHIPRTPGQEDQDKEEQEAILELERMERNIDRLKMAVCGANNKAGWSNVNASVSIRAAQFIKKKMNEIREEDRLRMIRYANIWYGSRENEERVITIQRLFRRSKARFTRKHLLGDNAREDEAIGDERAMLEPVIIAEGQQIQHTAEAKRGPTKTHIAIGGAGTDDNGRESMTEQEQEEKLPNQTGWLHFDANDADGREEFVGELFDDSEHGLGMMSWVDGTTYRGQFRDGKTSGFGHELYADSSSYKGEFANNLRHGFGVFVSPPGDQYKGEWLNGERHGRGIVSKTTEGQTKTVLGAFEGGDLVEILRDSFLEGELREKIDLVARQAMETAQKAKDLASEIRIQASSGGTRVEKVNDDSILGPQFFGDSIDIEGAEQGDSFAAAETSKPHEHLHTWLRTVLPLNPEQAQKELVGIIDAILSQGFTKPEGLLHFLLDVDAFDAFVDSLRLKAGQARLLWKALQDLDVVITPRHDYFGPEVCEHDKIDNSEVADASNAMQAEDMKPADHQAMVSAIEQATEMEIDIENTMNAILSQEAPSGTDVKEEEAAVRKLLMMTADEKERESRFINQNNIRVRHITKAIADEERRVRKERRRRIRNAINRMKLTSLFKIFPVWQENSHELANQRWAIALLCSNAKRSLQQPFYIAMLKEHHVRVCAAEKLEGASRRCQPRRVFRHNRIGIKRLQATLRRKISIAVPKLLYDARLQQFLQREKESEWEEIVEFERELADDMVLNYRAAAGEGAKNRFGLKWQCMEKWPIWGKELKNPQLENALERHVIQRHVTMEKSETDNCTHVLDGKTIQEVELSQYEFECCGITHLRLDHVIAAAQFFFTPSRIVKSPTEDKRVSLQELLVELQEIDRIETVRTKKRAVMSVAHKLEMLKRERLRTKLREEAERMKRHQEELLRRQKDEEERERERRWRLEQIRARKNAARKLEEARKAAEHAAMWAMWAQEEEQERERAFRDSQEKEADRIRARSLQRQVEQARLRESKRRQKILAVPSRRRRHCSPISQSISASMVGFDTAITEDMATKNTMVVRKKENLRSPLAVRIAREGWLPEIREEPARLLRPPPGLIPWDTRFHLKNSMTIHRGSRKTGEEISGVLRARREYSVVDSAQTRLPALRTGCAEKRGVMSDPCEAKTDKVGACEERNSVHQRKQGPQNIVFARKMPETRAIWNALLARRCAPIQDNRTVITNSIPYTDIRQALVELGYCDEVVDSALLDTVPVPQDDGDSSKSLIPFDEFRQLLSLLRPRSAQQHKTPWRKQVLLPAGALSVSAWSKMHPHAATRPRTSVRRLILIQNQIRQENHAKSLKHKLRRQQEAAGRFAKEKVDQELAVMIEKRRVEIEEISAQYEQTMAAILDFERQQIEKKREKEDAEREAAQKMSGARRSVLFPPLREKRRSLVDSIISRKLI